jgi:uncharacterized 2Fe-2S/4Fe-4S cluster protein (DUF4445 family)
MTSLPIWNRLLKDPGPSAFLYDNIPLMVNDSEMSGKHTVRLEPHGKILKVSSGTPLLDLLPEYGIEFPCGGEGTCLNCRIRILKGEMKTAAEFKALLRQKGLGEEWRLACKSIINQDVTLEVFSSDSLIPADNTSFPFTPAEGYGIAVDLGTSTLVVHLLNLSTGHVTDAVTAVNKQSRFGADIMSRISYALDPVGLEKLCRLIREQLGKIIHEMIARNGCFPGKIVMVGNTVMHHLFSKIDVTSLAHYPFTTSKGGKKSFRASELSWKLPEDTEIVFMPVAGGFIGSDVVAGIMATGMDQSDELTVFVDLGTNGEIAVGNRHRILAASTAAGPAFEGMQISHGMRAVTGAISSVFPEGNRLGFHVIGNVSPRGICGSGLIDAVAVLRAAGKISESGQLLSGQADIAIARSIKLTQKDIYEVILAKAAVASGIHILLTLLKKSVHDVKKVFIAGGFGYFITVSHAVGIGLLEFPVEKIVKAGNTALIGAKMFLFREENAEAPILSKIHQIPLESQPEFQDVFFQKMTLKKSDLF